jgi:hypothetical protein
LTIAERRAALWRASLWGGGGFWTIVVAGSGAFVYGASQRDILVMAGGPVLVALLVVVAAFAIAHRRAAQRFFFGFARSLGLAYVEKTRLLPLTPLLGAGDRRWVRHWMQGDLGDGLGGGLGHFVWQETKDDDDAGGIIAREHHRYTVCVIHLEESMRLFPGGMCLQPRRGIFPGHSDWLEGRAERRVKLESTAFNERYELHVWQELDEIVLRRLFAPKLVSWFANHPLIPGMELRGGTLVVFVERAIDDEGNLVFLLDAARHVAEAVRREVAEESRRPGQASPAAASASSWPR